MPMKPPFQVASMVLWNYNGKVLSILVLHVLYVHIALPRFESNLYDKLEEKQEWFVSKENAPTKTSAALWQGV